MIPLLLDALSTFRLTRLVTADTLLDGPRDAIVRWSYEAKGRSDDGPPMPDVPGEWSGWAMGDDRAPKPAVLVTCRWCASVWIGFGVVAARRFAPRAWEPVARALALSAVASLLSGLEK